MARQAVEWDWRYTPQFSSGRSAPARSHRKHAVPRGTEVALCNRRLYWRLPEADRRWMGAAADEVAVLAELAPCQSCLGVIARLATPEEETSD